MMEWRFFDVLGEKRVRGGARSRTRRHWPWVGAGQMLATSGGVHELDRCPPSLGFLCLLRASEPRGGDGSEGGARQAGDSSAL